MSELAAAIDDTKNGTEDCTTTMHDALQQHLGIPIELGEVAYLPPTDSVRVQVRPQSDTAEFEHQLSRSNGDLQLNSVQGSLTFEFK